jgi:hypothetical protein
VLPHFPWSYLPDGTQYEVESSSPVFPIGAAGELGEDWLLDSSLVLRNEYRYRLQVGFVDRLIGELLDRLEQTELLDECLLIVTADHGVSFRAGHSRRLPDADNLAELISVPLFIKLPHQSVGQTDDRNVQSVDIYPTIAEVLGVDPPEPIDGLSVTRPVRPRRKTFCYDNSMTAVEPTLPQRVNAVRSQFEKFGSDKLQDLPAEVSTHPDWHGRQIDEFVIDEKTVPYIRIDPLHWVLPRFRPVEATLVKGFVAGRLDASRLRSGPVELVVAINGTIVASGRTAPLNSFQHGFEFMLPEVLTPEEADDVQVYLVEQLEGAARLRRLKDPIGSGAASAN